MMMPQRLFIGLLLAGLLGLLSLSGLPASRAASLQPAEDSYIFLPVVAKNYSSIPGSLEGYIIDAQTGEPIEFAEVCVLENCYYTEGDGWYEFPVLRPGEHLVEASADNYFSASQPVLINSLEPSALNVALSPDIAAGMRIVLTWEETIRFHDPISNEWIDNDMDAYAWVPYDSGYRQIYWGDKGDCNGIPYACLERDWKLGFGPETVLFTSFYPATYYFAVNYYADFNDPHDVVPTITQSQAQVEVYDSSGLVASLQVPTTGEGTWWHVFEMDGESGVITATNTIAHGPPSP